MTAGRSRAWKAEANSLAWRLLWHPTMCATPRVAERLVPPNCFKVLAALALMLAVGLPAPAPADDGTLDVVPLRVRLKDTPAIGSSPSSV